VIEELERAAAEAPQERRAQRALAAHLTTLVHGEEGLREAEAMTEQMFGGAELADTAQSIALASFATWPDLFVAAGLASSKGEARRLIQGGGLYVGDRKIGPDDAPPTADDFPDDVTVLRKGRKTRVPVQFT
jgi:tyrosyl-tRNA synthetase